MWKGSPRSIAVVSDRINVWIIIFIRQRQRSSGTMSFFADIVDSGVMHILDLLKRSDLVILGPQGCFASMPSKAR